MRLEIANNNGTRYIRIVENVRITDAKGIRTNRKRTIANIGPVSRFDDGKPDYEERLKESFKEGHPLIEDLIQYVPKEQPLKKYSIMITENSAECVGHPKLFSHILIERIMEELDLQQVIGSYKNFSKIQFDLMGYIRLMIYGRILNPASKIATVSQNVDYYEPIISDDYHYHIYDALDFVYKHKKQIFNRINSQISKKFSRNTDIIYYDVTNFYFEIEGPDDDTVVNDDIVEKGLRKKGVSKENRTEPIVQMGLFMDNSGIPISYEIYPGNTLDHNTVRPSLKSTVDNMEFKRFIFVGDRGMCNYHNLLHILSTGNGYIVSKSIAKSKKADQDWIYDDSDYTVESGTFKHKSRIVTRNVKDENGKMTKVTEKEVVYWNKHFYDRQAAENKSFLEFLDKLVESPNNFRVTTTQSKSIRRFLKSDAINIKTGEITNSNELRAIIDLDKIKEYKKAFGYYQIVTSETQKSNYEVIDIYHGLSRIEDQFRVLKGDLSTRPMFVNTAEHIDAHLAICTIALIVMRILQKQIVDSKLLPDNTNNWSYGMSAERIQKALNKWTIESIADDYFRFNYIDDDDLKLILDAFKINIPHKLFRKKDLKQLKKDISFSS